MVGLLCDVELTTGVAVTVTVLVVAAEGPLQPVLTTLIVTLPAQPFGQVTTPVPELIAPAVMVPTVFVMLVNDQLKVPTLVELL